MLIKHKEDSRDSVERLSGLLRRDLPKDKKALIERELKYLLSGIKGEETSAYFLDFEFRHTRNWMLLHDLRLEHNGDVAQIDHLLIGRMLDMYVIESKNYKQGVTISEEGDFSYFYGKRPIPIESPVAQNERHIRLLNRFLTDRQLLPKRMGITLFPSYHNIVLISPTSRVSKPSNALYDCSAIMKSDKFRERFDKDINDESIGALFSIAKVISHECLRQLALKLKQAHKPASPDYEAKFGLRDQETGTTVADAEVRQPTGHENEHQTTAPDCPKCGAQMVQRIAKRGKHIDETFWGCPEFPKCRSTLACNF